MASMNISEADFAVLASATLDAEACGDMEQAHALDKLARKASAALSNAKYSGARGTGLAAGMPPLKWEQVKSLLGVVKTT